MQGFAALAVGLLITASVVVGLRLVALHRRTGGAPELMLGLMLLLSVGLGYPLLIAASRSAEPGLVRPLYILSALVTNAGFSLLFLFNARVFRPEASWAHTVAGAGVMALLVNAGWRCFDTHTEIRMGADAVTQSVLQMVPILAAYFWTAWESLRYFNLMQRRVRLGIGDPEVCDRFRLCGAMALFAAIGVLLNLVAIVMRIDTLESPGVLLASCATGLAQATLMVLAFAPPRSYLTWVHTRSRAVAV